MEKRRHGFHDSKGLREESGKKGKEKKERKIMNREKTWELRCCANYGIMEESKVRTNLMSKPYF